MLLRVELYREVVVREGEGFAVERKAIYGASAENANK
jgi:hypothetical protein